MIGKETTNLLDYLPTNPYDWQWRTCSGDHIAPAQKPNRSKRVIVVRRVYLYGFQADKVARSLNTTVHHIHAHSGYCLLNHRPTRQLVCQK